MAKKNVSMEALKSFVRKEGSKFLKQDNITSIGIGYKITNGKPTKTLSIQFTVGKKVELESLEEMGEKLIPKTITIDGVEVPTDVLPRSYGITAREVKAVAKLEAAAGRKTVVNPIVPGVSIGHPEISAGTAGCVVYDAQSGEPYVLSNWHVLNGEFGEVGDPIVQPGSYDDNRVDQNVVGHLVRSYLGIAGDCAVARIEERRLEPEIYDLGVAVARIGEPELGDKVVKSGRTTDVTYGVVNRIHTTVKIDYDSKGEQEIGCFEIGPDPDKPAANDEISMGGDSGSAWLHMEAAGVTDMMLGLHFAGETGDAPDHALACYPGSVFEKLGILPARPEQPVFPEGEIGFATSFLGSPVPFPKAVVAEIADDLLEVDGKKRIDYTHFSLAMSKSRRFARWVAWNIDGGSIKKISRKSAKFKKDPKVPAEAQIGNELYANNPLDRGHIARRADLLWGPQSEAKKANADSFCYTNITPQHSAFNQSGAHGIWGQLEDALFEEVDVEDLRVSVMGGPILQADDPEYRGARLPKQFWKTLFFKDAADGQLQVKCYVLTQKDLLTELEVLELPEFAVYEVSLEKITELTGLEVTIAAAPEAVDEPKKKAKKAKSRAEQVIRKVNSVAEIIA